MMPVPNQVAKIDAEQIHTGRLRPATIKSEADREHHHDVQADTEQYQRFSGHRCSSARAPLSKRGILARRRPDCLSKTSVDPQVFVSFLILLPAMIVMG
jgi:hypothetical protein